MTATPRDPAPTTSSATQSSTQSNAPSIPVDIPVKPIKRLRQQALQLAERGYAVVPVHVTWDGEDKTLRFPLGGWQDTATTDPEVILNWGLGKATHIGINTQASGIVVVDLDKKHGKNGLNAWADLLNQHPGTELGPEAATPSGGVHIPYRARPGMPTPNSQDDIAEGIDTRGVGGFLIAYDDHAAWPPVSTLPPVPEWVPRAVRASTKPTPEAGADGGHSDLAKLLAEGVDEGGRDKWLTKVAGHLAKSHRHFDGYLAVLQTVNSGRCRPALDDAQVEKVAKSIWSREKAKRPEDDELDLLTPEKLEGELLDTYGLDSIPDPRYVVKGWLDLDTISRLNGKPGHGKSFVAIDMAAHVGSGLEWQGHKIRQGTVVYVAAEGGSGIKKRVRAWEKHHRRRMENVLFLPRAIRTSLRADRDLVPSHEWRTLIEVCERIKPVLIVLDTQARITVGLEENSATDMGHFVEQIEFLRARTGACVMVIHHLGHNGDHGRGSSSVLGALGTEMKIDRGEGALELSNPKQKDNAAAEPLSFRLKAIPLWEDEDGERVTSCVIDRLDRERLEELRDRVMVETIRLIDEAKIPNDASYRKLQEWGRERDIKKGNAFWTAIAKARKARDE
ncbi:AAA family ATPase [Nonomuraea sp. LP-02]|uniref:AAA family ATPase n=1 Tax=Nonomuraea sp. LP-02 TaxID=3097960 RepID=UPI002E37733E|nr:AAA family ATPase [Nonomuraea sp. LP-02]MED7929316.1 AAA family ATPase [Nonomuraea sp. LP-02]